MSTPIISPQETIWHLYIIETRLMHWYTGITTDVKRRLSQHSDGTGAKALKGKGPLTLILSVPVGSRAEASKLEYRVKQLSKQQKVAWANACLSTGNVCPIEK